MSKNGFATDRQKFCACWYLGRLRKRQQRLEEALSAYNEAGLPNNDIISQPEAAAFFLDYAVALMAWGAETLEGSAFERAGQLFSIAEELARNAGDHVTRVKALMQLAHGNYLGGAVEIARQQINEAQKCVTMTRDLPLQKRIDNLKLLICGNG